MQLIGSVNNLLRQMYPCVSGFGTLLGMFGIYVSTSMEGLERKDALHFEENLTRTKYFKVADPDPNPDPEDPYVFEPSVSGSISQRYGSGSYLIPTVFCDFFMTFYLLKMM
jgi:hypothetical protein